jgi:cytidylate kinase
LGFVIAIDGPAGAGKSSVAKSVARQTGLSLVDTGAIYRSLALAAEESGVHTDDEPGLATLASRLELSFSFSDNTNHVFLFGKDVSELIRLPAISENASRVSRHPAVRNALLGLQRKFGSQGKGAVLEGRDIGTVVFPYASVKIFLTASAEERARRRTDELQESGQAADYETVLNDINRRDHEDSNREIAPLRQAEDARLVDSTGKNSDEVVSAILLFASQHPDFPVPTVSR